MTIIVDTLGGDKPCAELTQGVIDAVREYGIDAVAVGDEAVIAPLVEAAGLSARIAVLHAPVFVSMEDPSLSVRSEKADASMVQAMKLLAEGGGDAAVTAGNTGAAITAATLYVKRINGIRRAALSPILPFGKGVLLIDSGANIECTAEYLVQFAYMGSFYAQFAMQTEGGALPRVGLLNIGAEATKGDALRKETYTLLREADTAGRIRFVGNIEARDVPFDAADVVVADGFSGNILLKASEGVGLYFADALKHTLLASLPSKIGALFMQKGIRTLKRSMNYKEVGGSPLIGISAPVIKTHGSADAFTMKNAIRQAIRYAEGDIVSKIADNIAFMKLEPQAQA